MTDTGEQYEASASALGYLFQFVKALHICCATAIPLPGYCQWRV